MSPKDGSTYFSDTLLGIILKLVVSIVLALLIYNAAIAYLFGELSAAFQNGSVERSILRDDGRFFDEDAGRRVYDRAVVSQLLIALQPENVAPELSDDGCVDPEGPFGLTAYIFTDPANHICREAGTGEAADEEPTLGRIAKANLRLYGAAPNNSNLTDSVAAGLAARPAASTCLPGGARTVAGCLFEAPDIEICKCAPLPAPWDSEARASLALWVQSVVQPTLVMPEGLTSANASLVMGFRTPSLANDTPPDEGTPAGQPRPLTPDYRAAGFQEFREASEAEGGRNEAELDQSEAIAQLATLAAAQTALIGRLADDPDVQHFAFLLGATLGVEQFLMLILFFYLVFVIVQRLIKRMRSSTVTAVADEEINASVDALPKLLPA